MRKWRNILASGVIATSLLASSMSAFAVSFDDVSGAENEKAITKLVSLGYLNVKGSNFNPEATVSRAEFATIANKVVDFGAPGKIKVTDLKGTNTPALKMIKGGVLTLNKKGQFESNKKVTYLELAKLLSFGFGFKKSWTNSPADYLFFLDRKGVLSIDTKLDANITREDLAVAIDNYLTVKGVYKYTSGVISDVNETGFTLKNESGVSNFKFAGSPTLFLDNQLADRENFGLGTTVSFLRNTSGSVVFVDGVGVDSFEGTLGMSNGKITVASTSYNVNLNSVIVPLPNDPTGSLSFAQFSNYATKAGVEFFGSIYTNLENDEATVILPTISKVNNRLITLGVDKVAANFSANALPNQNFAVTANTVYNLTVDGATSVSTLAAILTYQAELQASKKSLVATFELYSDGTVKTLTAKSQ